MKKWIPWLCCAALGVLAFVFRFLLAGYSFSALVCCGIIALIAFYTLLPAVRGGFPRLGRALGIVVTAALIVGGSIAAVTEAVIIAKSFGDPDESADYVIVLGAKVRDDGPSVSLWDRINAAYDYLMAHPDCIAVVSGGQGADEPMTEAQSMYNELVALGIDPSRIWMEEEATSTMENIRLSLALIEVKTSARPQKVAVLSSEYHLCRAELMTHACGAEFVGVPAVTSRFFQRVNHFLREIAGVWHFILLGE